MELKDQIRIAREAKGYSQYDLAAHLQISRTAILWWEQGSHRPNSRRLPELEKVLGVRFDLTEKGLAEPIDASGKTFDIDPDVLQLAMQIRNLPKSHRDAMLILVKISSDKVTGKSLTGQEDATRAADISCMKSGLRAHDVDLTRVSKDHGASITQADSKSAKSGNSRKLRKAVG